MRARSRTTAAVVTSVGAVVAAGLAVAPVAAGATPASSAVPAAAPAGAYPHHLSGRLEAYLNAQDDGLGARATARTLGLAESGPGSLIQTPDGSQLVVTVRFADYAASEVAAVEAAGGDVLNRNPDFRRITISAAPDDLAAIGDVPGVEYVGETVAPMTNQTCDTTKSEGDGILKASNLRTAKSLDGTGVKVGVLSDSYSLITNGATTAAQDVTNDDLPGATNTCGHTTAVTVGTQPTTAQGGGEDEGRAMAQTVHDLAPGAAIDFESAFLGEDVFASNIDKLVSQGAKVVVDDVTYFDEPFYQDGVIEQAVTRARAAGADYFSSAANNSYPYTDATGTHQVGSYEAVGGYRPTTCPALITGHADCHDFNTAGTPDSSFTFTGNPNQAWSFTPILNWAEPWGGVVSDLDLYLIDETTNKIVSSSAYTDSGASGSQQSVEFLQYTPTSARRADTYSVVVARRSSAAPAATPRFKMVFAENGYTPFKTLEHATPTGTDVMGPTVFGHNGGADAVSVGAQDGETATGIENYSSYGPVTMLFGPVQGSGAAAPALATPRVVPKPEIVATDCGRNSFFGFQDSANVWRFCGTSQAAPHAAAVAALLKQQRPLATPEQINAAMASTATPIAGVPAVQQGAGLVNALAASGAPQLLPAAPALSGTDPSSPSPVTTPKVKGTAEAGSTVRLFTNPSCTGTPAVTGLAAALASPGLAVTVPANSTTAFYATATDAANNVSPCSTTPVTYVSDSTAPVAPTVSGTDVTSPGTATALKVKGTAEAGSTVKVYSNATCTGTVAGSGSAGDFASTGLGVSAAANASTTFYATATDAAGNASPCSTTSVTYVNDSTAPVAPTVSGTDPTSPSAVTTPRVKGAAEAGSTVRVYTNATCTGVAAATGPAAQFAAPGLTVTVPVGTTALAATATDAAGNVSPCSTGAASYTAFGAPDTTLTSVPKAKVTTKKKKAKVSFSFTSPVAGATFTCSLDGAAYTPCTSGSKITVKVGKHTFVVRATANGLTDATPATTSFKVVKKKAKHHHGKGAR